MTGDHQNRRAFLAKTAFAGGLVLSGVGSVSAASTVRVDPNDSDAYDSIQAALDEAPDGATVEIAPGVYEGGNHVPASKSLTIRGDPGDDDKRGAGANAPVIDGDGQVQTGGFVLPGPDEGKSLVIEGIHIRNVGQGIDDDNWGNGIMTGERSDVIVRDVSITDVEGRGISAGGGGGGSPTNWTVERCRFDSIARIAVDIAASDSVVRDNLVVATESVADAEEGTWWEEDTPPGNPTVGLRAKATAGPDNTATTENVVIADNEVRGQYDIAAVMIVSQNYAGQGTFLENVDIRGNRIRLDKTESDAEQMENAGIWISSNPGGRGNDVAEVRELTVADNEISNTVYGVFGNFKGTPTTGSDNSTATIDCRNNVIVNSRAGVGMFNRNPSTFEGLTVTQNRFERYGVAGVIAWAEDGTIDGVDVTENEYSYGDAPDDGVNTYGVEVVSQGGDVTGVHVDGESISNTLYGVLAFAGAASTVDVDVTGTTFTGNQFGVVAAAGSNSTAEFEARETTFESNETGIQVDNTTADGDVQVSNSDFVGNTNYAVENIAEGGVVDATCNYWGHPTGPEHETNKKGQGNPVTDGVDYDPLLPQSHTKVSANACHPVGGSGKDGGTNGNSGGPPKHAGNNGHDGAKPKAPGKPPGVPPGPPKDNDD